MIINVNTSGKNDQPLEENVGEYLYDLSVGGGFLNEQ